MIEPVSKKEEQLLWNEMMELLRDHPRWVLDNLETLPEFKVSWNTYSPKKVNRIQCIHCLKFNQVDRKTCKKCGKELKNRKIHSFGIGKPPKRPLKPKGL